MGTELDERHSHCGHRAHCQSIYRRLGQAQGPSVTGKALVAFGIPIGVFIITLAIAVGALGAPAAELNRSTALALLIAVAVTAAVVLAIWRITQRPVDQRDPPDSESTH